MAVITISKQYGSLADEIALSLCKKLGYRYFEKRNIHQLAEEAGLSEKDVFDLTVDEIEKKNLFHIVAPHPQQITLGGYASGGTFNYGSAMSTYLNFSSQLDMEHALTMIQSIMRSAVKKGNMVIAGRGGQALFQDTPDVYHVRIIAPLDIRIQNVMAVEKVDSAEAKKMIKKHDSAAESYLKSTYKIDWNNPDLYHLILNSHKLDVEAAVKAISDLIS